MDTQTLQAYDADASGFAKQWREQPAPDDMYALLARYFRQGPTVDIGCGAGRDVAWLAANGYDARGVDASDSLLREARQAYPASNSGTSRCPASRGSSEGARRTCCAKR